MATAKVTSRPPHPLTGTLQGLTGWLPAAERGLKSGVARGRRSLRLPHAPPPPPARGGSDQNLKSPLAPRSYGRQRAFWVGEGAIPIRYYGPAFAPFSLTVYPQAASPNGAS